MPYFLAFINITIQVARYTFTRLSLGYAKWETGGSQGIQILIYQKCPSAFNWITLPIHQQHMNMYSPILGKIKFYNLWQSVSQSVSSVAQSCPTLCDPINRSTSRLLVHHQLPESTQTHVHQFSDTIQPSHPLLSPYPPALNLSQHQGLFA